MLMTGFETRPVISLNEVSARSAARSMPPAKARMPRASQYWDSTGTPSRTCSAGAPFITAPRRISSCQVPWPAEITNEVPPSRAMAACMEASVRREGLKKSRPRIFPARAWGSGFCARRSANARSSMTCSRGRSARSRKFFMSRDSEGRERGAQAVDVFFLEDECGQQPQDGRVTGCARQDALGQQRLLHVLGWRVQTQPVQEAQAL